MADNVIADPGAGGAEFATDDIGGVHYPRTKVTWGPDGTANDVDNATNKRLPVNIAESIALPVTDNGGSLTVDGTVAVTNGGLTELAAAINASSQMDVNIAASGATVPVSNAGLTELAAAINPSAQMDVNIAASAVGLTVNSHPVTNAGTFAVQASQSGTWNVGTVATITNVVHVDDNAASLTVDDGGSSLTVDGTVAVTNAGLTELAAAINASSQMDVNIAASGTTLTVGSHAVTNAGTFAVQAAQSGTWTVQPGNTANTTPWLASIHDGTTKASVADLTNSNPLHVAIVDGTGTQIASFGGGTQYTEDVAAAADPVGTALIVVRNDARTGSLTTTNGDNIAARGTNAGELYVKHVDAIPITDNAGSLTVDGTVAATQSGTWNVATVTAVTALTNALPAGTNNIGDVDVASIVPGTGATNLGKAEDAVHASGDVGVMALAVRQSTQAGFGADGDYVPFSVDDDGGLRVSVVAGGGSGGTAQADDADFTAGTTPGTPAMGVYESSPSSVTNGDLGTVGITQTRALRTVVEGNVAVTNAGLTELAGAINGSAQMDVNIAASAATLTVASHAVTNAGTFAVQAAQSGTWTVQPGNTANTTPWLASIHDGTTKASVADLTNSNPLHVAIVDGAGSQVTSFGGGTQYTEDAAAAADPVGTALVMVRNDARTGSLTTTDGDNIAARGTNTGELYVKHVDTIPATQSGTWNIGTLSTVTNVVHVDDNASTLSIDDGGGIITVDGTVAVTNAGLTELAAAINASSQMDVNIAASAATLTVASHAVTNAGTFVVQENGAALTALQVIDNPVVVDDAAFTPATTSVMMAGFTFDDVTPDSVNEGDAGAARMSANRNIYTTIRDAAGNERGANVNASSQLSVSVDNTVTVGSHAVTNAGTFAVQATVTNAGTFAVQAAGDVAHDSADSGSPVKVGAKATTAITGITAVANNDRTQLYAGTDGVLLVRENSNLESLSRGTAAITDGSSTSVIAAAGANIKTYITDVIISNSSATYVTVDIRDGTAGSVMATFPAPATSGCVHRVGSPFAGTANTAVAADPSAAASTVTVTLLGFKSLI